MIILHYQFKNINEPFIQLGPFNFLSTEGEMREQGVKTINDVYMYNHCNNTVNNNVMHYFKHDYNSTDIYEKELFQ